MRDLVQVFLEPINGVGVIPDLAVGMLAMVHVDGPEDEVSRQLGGINRSELFVVRHHNVFYDEWFIAGLETFFVDGDVELVLAQAVLATEAA